jgi:hypothetical protein
VIEIIGRGRNSIFGTTHCLKQEEYLLHKAHLIAPIISKNGITYRKARTIGQAQISLYTISSVEWQRMWSVFHQDSVLQIINGRKSYRKRVTPQILDALGEQGLAIWIMDDGSLVARESGRRFKLCTHGFTLEDNKLIVEWLNDRYNSNAKVSIERKGDGRDYPFVHMGAIGYNKIIPLIKPYIIPTMLYKIDMKYKRIDSQINQ